MKRMTMVLALLLVVLTSPDTVQSGNKMSGADLEKCIPVVEILVESDLDGREYDVIKKIEVTAWDRKLRKKLCKLGADAILVLPLGETDEGLPMVVPGEGTVIAWKKAP